MRPLASAVVRVTATIVPPFPMGLNHPGPDHRRFALNVVRRMAGALG